MLALDDTAVLALQLARLGVEGRVVCGDEDERGAVVAADAVVVARRRAEGVLGDKGNCGGDVVCGAAVLVEEGHEACVGVADAEEEDVGWVVYSVVMVVSVGEEEVDGEWCVLDIVFPEISGQFYCHVYARLFLVGSYVAKVVL